MRQPALHQKTRFSLLLIEVALLLAASWFAMGKFLPPSDPGDNSGFWFYTALLGLLLGSRLDTPFFAKPADVVLYAAPAAIALALSNSWAQWNSAIRAGYSIAVGYCILTGVLGALAIVSMGKKDEHGRFSNVTRVLAETLGAPQIIYSAVIGFALFAFHVSSPRQFAIIAAAWVLTGVYSLPEFTLRLWRRLHRVLFRSDVAEVAGEAVAFQTPNRVLLRQSEREKIACGDLLVIGDPLGERRLALALDRHGRDEGILIRAVELPTLPIPESIAVQFSDLPRNSVLKIQDLKQTAENEYISKCKLSLVGLVAEDTSINKLYVDVVEGASISEGMILEVIIQSASVLYQIVEGVTQEDVIFQKNTRGFAKAEARKVGRWNVDKQTFQHAKWIPAMHTPVFRVTGPEQVLDDAAIGRLPATNYPVRLKDIHELVTHNTAILGILGVGKSMLAIELVERMISEGIKVVCLDLTNQYANQLSDFYDPAGEKACVDKIRVAADKDRDRVEDSKSQGGSLENLRRAIRDDLAAFLCEDCAARLKIYNPAQLNASIQYGDLRNKKVGPGQNDWKAVAAFRETTPAEIAQIVTESCLALVQDAMRDKAKVCLVFEEAHSLIPEYGNLTVDSDKHAVAGTARAILQGRKYGMGCVLVSQRTANVTKTILNQCNTVFAFRTFDDTGMAFLENYLGRDYAHVLPSLEERHVVLFGKASSCENPVMMRVNDRPDFIARFRAKFPAPQKPPNACVPP